MQEKQLIQFCEFLARLLGEHAEVVLHNREGCILWISGGHITGRKAGLREPSTAMELLARQAKNDGKAHIVGYRSASRTGVPLKSSNLFVRDEMGEVVYTVCVNQDISGLLQMRDLLESMVGQEPLRQEPDPSTDTLEDLILKMILQEMENCKPIDMDSREDKLRLIARLSEKGIFAARGAAATVCSMLHIAQPTLYKYLQELKNEE